MDDFILFGLTREQCVEHQARIVAFLRDKLRLELSKATIAPLARGVNFVGYRTWASRRFIRKHSMYKMRRAARRKKLDSVVSILGHAKRTHSLRHLVATVQEIDRDLHRQLPKIFRRHSHHRAANP